MNLCIAALLVIGSSVFARPHPQIVAPIVDQDSTLASYIDLLLPNDNSGNSRIATTNTGFPAAGDYSRYPKLATASTNPSIVDANYGNAGPPTTSPTNGLSSGTGKRGLAFNSSSPSPNIFNGDNKITWAHDWYSSSFDVISDQFAFVPTLTDTSAASLQVWDKNVQAALSKDSSSPKYLMSFNEPDYWGSQSYLEGLGNIDTAVAAYKQYMNKYGSDTVKLGSPSVTNGVENEMGIAYLTNFLGACNDCKIDFVPVHWYGCNPGPACNVNSDVQLFKNQIGQAMEAAKGKPVWIPEFQHKGGLSDQRAFLEQVLPWLDEQTQIERYAYFMLWDGFLTTDARKNEVGMVYAS